MSKHHRLKRETKRSYTPSSIKASSHPTRYKIISSLRTGSKTTVDLEKVTGETRYNLYHHLAVLEESGLIRHRMVGKVKEYSITSRRKPPTAYYQADKKDMFTDQSKFKHFLSALEDLIGEEIPSKNDVRSISVTLTYPWTKE